MPFYPVLSADGEVIGDATGGTTALAIVKRYAQREDVTVTLTTIEIDGKETKAFVPEQSF